VSKTGYVKAANKAAVDSAPAVMGDEDVAGMPLGGVFVNSTRDGFEAAVLAAALHKQTTLVPLELIPSVAKRHLVRGRPASLGAQAHLVKPRHDIHGKTLGAVVLEAQMPAGFMVNSDGAIVQVNEAGQQLLGLPEQDIIAHPLLDLLDEGSKVVVFESLQSALQASAPHQTTAKAMIAGVVGPDGSKKVTTTECVLDMMPRKLPEGKGVLVLVQVPRGAAPRMVGRHVTSEDLSSHYDKEAPSLAHRDMEGALGRSSVPTEPMARMLFYIHDQVKDTEYDLRQPFDVKQLRQYILNTRPDQREFCLKTMNPWKMKKVDHVFQQMDKDGDGMVRHDEFQEWFEAQEEAAGQRHIDVELKAYPDPLQITVDGS